MIDFEAVNVFKSVVSLKVNPAAAILAETLSSLNFCRKKGEGHLRCCVPLLFVWTVSHIVTGKASGIFRTPWHLHSKLENFARHSLNELGKTTWSEMFFSLEKSEFHWRAQYAFFRSYLAYCGNHPWVPLIGARCCISYCPNMFLRQLGFEQFIPRTTGLAEYYEDLKVSRKLLGEAKIAWRNRGIVTPERRVDGRTSLGYSKWQQTRGKGYRVPPFEGPSRLMNETMEDVRQEINAQHEFYHDNLHSQLAMLKKKKRKLEESLSTRDHVVSALEMENKELRDQLQQVKNDLEMEVDKLTTENAILEEFKDSTRG